MRLGLFGLTVLAVAGWGTSAMAADPGAVPPVGAVQTVTARPGVVPPGTSLVVETNDAIRTHRALRGTIYDGRVAESVQDQSGNVLIPRGSPVELVVRSLPYLGPGGVGMTELAIDARAVIVNGVTYPVETQVAPPNAGGLAIQQHSAQWLGGGETTGRVLTVGNRINVPADAMLAFRIEDPIRLQGYSRQ